MIVCLLVMFATVLVPSAMAEGDHRGSTEIVGAFIRCSNQIVWTSLAAATLIGLTYLHFVENTLDTIADVMDGGREDVDDVKCRLIALSPKGAYACHGPTRQDMSCRSANLNTAS